MTLSILTSYCCYSITKSCLTLCSPMNSSPASLSPRAFLNSCPLSWWCHPAILFSDAPFSSCPQSFPASESFPVSQLFASGSQSIGTLVSASVLLMNIQGWFPLGLTGLISLQFKDLSRSIFSTATEKHSLWSAFFMVQLTSICDYWKNDSFD